MDRTSLMRPSARRRHPRAQSWSPGRRRLACSRRPGDATDCVRPPRQARTRSRPESSRTSASTSTSARRSRSTCRSSTTRPRPSRSESTSPAKPVVLQLGYYGCPMLCDLVSQRAGRLAQGRCSLTAGKDFEVVYVSIDPHEDAGRWPPEEAGLRRASTAAPAARRGLALPHRQAKTRSTSSPRPSGFNYKWVARASSSPTPPASSSAPPTARSRATCTA